MVNPGVVSSGAPTWAQIAFTGLRAAEHWLTIDRRKPSARIMRVSWAYLVPYCVHPTSRPSVYCVVHRGYHALGCLSWTDYEAAEPWHITAFERGRLLKAGVIDGNGYLFDDLSAPWRSRADLKRYVGKLRVMIEPWIERAPTPEAA